MIRYVAASIFVCGVIVLAACEPTILLRVEVDEDCPTNIPIVTPRAADSLSGGQMDRHIQLTVTPREAVVFAYVFAKHAQLVSGRPEHPNLKMMEKMYQAVAGLVDPDAVAGKVVALFNAGLDQLGEEHGVEVRDS